MLLWETTLSAMTTLIYFFSFLLSFFVLPYAKNVLYAEKTDFNAGGRDSKKWLQA